MYSPGADTGLLRGGGGEFYKIMHHAHAQMIDQIHFWHLVMDDNDAKVKNNGPFTRNH